MLLCASSYWNLCVASGGTIYQAPVTHARPSPTLAAACHTKKTGQAVEHGQGGSKETGKQNACWRNLRRGSAESCAMFKCCFFDSADAPLLMHAPSLQHTKLKEAQAHLPGHGCSVVVAFVTLLGRADDRGQDQKKPGRRTRKWRWKWGPFTGPESGPVSRDAKHEIHSGSRLLRAPEAVHFLAPRIGHQNNTIFWDAIEPTGGKGMLNHRSSVARRKARHLYGRHAPSYAGTAAAQTRMSLCSDRSVCPRPPLAGRRRMKHMSPHPFSRPWRPQNREKNLRQIC